MKLNVRISLTRRVKINRASHMKWNFLFYVIGNLYSSKLWGVMNSRHTNQTEEKEFIWSNFILLNCSISDAPNGENPTKNPLQIWINERLISLKQSTDVHEKPRIHSIKRLKWTLSLLAETRTSIDETWWTV